MQCSGVQQTETMTVCTFWGIYWNSLTGCMLRNKQHELKQ